MPINRVKEFLKSIHTKAKFLNPKPSGLFGRSIQWGGVDLRLNGF